MLLKNTKNWVATQMLRRLLKRPREKIIPHSYAEIEKVWLLFDTSSEPVIEEIKVFVETLSNESLDCSGIACWAKESEPAAASLPKNILRLGKKDLNFWKLPKANFRKKIDPKPAELLLMLSPKPSLALQFLAAWLPAGFKMGPYQTSIPNPYDFMIQYPDSDAAKNPSHSSSFVASTQHYLSLLIRS